MDGLEELLPAGVSLTIAGKEYRLMPLRLADRAEASALLRARKTPAVDALRKLMSGELPAEAQRELVSLAFTAERAGETIDSWELDRWLASEEGLVYSFWFQVRQRHPEVSSIDKAERLRAAWVSDTATTEQAERLRRELERQEMPLGNSSGPIPPGNQGEATSLSQGFPGVASFAH